MCGIHEFNVSLGFSSSANNHCVVTFVLEEASLKTGTEPVSEMYVSDIY